MISSVRNTLGMGTGTSKKSLVSEITKALDPKARNNKPKSMTQSVLESSKEYQEKLAASRQKKTDTANAKKRVQYSHKSLSSAILRSKTSRSARLAAGKARREVAKLKAKAQTGEYDQDELQLAITHAKAMEIVAKKKAKHLAQEELVKISDDAKELSEDMKNRPEAFIDDEEESEEISDATQEDLAENQYDSLGDVADDLTQDILQELMQEMSLELEMPVDELAQQMGEEMAALLSEMMDDTGLEDLMDSLFTDTKPQMTEEEFKKVVTKHRNDENKAIVHADMEYMKGMFEHFEKAGTDFNITV